MATIQKQFVATKYLETTQTAQYTSPTSTSSTIRTIIDKCVVCNSGSTRAKLSVNMIINGGSASDENRVINEKYIEPNETYLCPELIGVILESGGFLSTLTDQSNTLTFYLSGREIT